MLASALAYKTDGFFIRDGKTVADLDIYDFIMEGRLKDDIRLQDGDVILVNPYQTLVQILGR